MSRDDADAGAMGFRSHEEFVEWQRRQERATSARLTQEQRERIKALAGEFADAHRFGTRDQIRPALEALHTYIDGL